LLVGLDVLLGHDVDAAQVVPEGGDVQLVLLFGHLALGEQQQLVPGAEVGQRRGDTRHQLHPMLDQRDGQRVDLTSLGLARRPFLQTGETLAETT